MFQWQEYHRMPSVVEAAQVSDDTYAGLIEDLGGQIIPPTEIREHGTALCVVATDNGQELVYAGDWIVKHEDGRLEVFSSRDFHRDHQFMPEGTRWVPFNPETIMGEDPPDDLDDDGDDPSDGSPTEPPDPNGNGATVYGDGSSNGVGIWDGEHLPSVAQGVEG